MGPQGSRMHGSAQVKLLSSQYLVVWQSGSFSHSGISSQIPCSLSLYPSGQTHLPDMISRMSPRELSHTHLPWESTMNPSSLGQGTQLPFSSKAYPGGHTQFSFSSKMKPRPGGQVFTGVHSMEASPSYPSIQIQVIVRTGNVSNTVQMAFNPQGSAKVQGLIHCPEMHAVCDGQSTSLRHPISTLTHEAPGAREPSNPAGQVQST